MIKFSRLASAVAIALLAAQQSVAVPLNAHECSGDLVVWNTSSGTDVSKLQQFSARIRVQVRADSSAGAITFEQRSGRPSVDAAIVKAISKWRFPTWPRECTTIIIPIKVFGQP